MFFLFTVTILISFALINALCFVVSVSVLFLVCFKNIKDGHSLTEMYTKLMETQDQLRVERANVQRMDAYLQQVCAKYLLFTSRC